MSDVIAPDMSDEQVKAVLDGVDPKDREAVRKACAQATPKQVYEVIFPYMFAKQPDLQEKLKAAKMEGSVQWVLQGEAGGEWAVTFAEGSFTIAPGTKADATATVTMSMDDWRAIQRGEILPQAAFMAGKMKIAGNMGFIMKLQTVMPQA